jgi:uncharacterized protein YukE
LVFVKGKAGLPAGREVFEKQVRAEGALNISPAPERKLLIEEIKRALPFFKAALPAGAGLYLSDRTEIVWCEDSSLGAVYTRGEKILPGSVPDRVIRTGAPVTETYDEKRFGVAYVVSGVPVREADGDIRGVLMRVRFMQSTAFIEEAFQPLRRIVRVIAEKTGNLSVQSEELSTINRNIGTYAAQVASAGDEISSVTNLVSEIAGNTHLLGLNAAIQAARAGEYGRGFMVVAEEIRKMSEKTKEATKTTSKQLEEVQERVFRLSEELIRMSGAIQKLTENIGAINEMIIGYEKEVAAAVSRLEEKMQTLFK